MKKRSELDQGPVTRRDRPQTGRTAASKRDENERSITAARRSPDEDENKGDLDPRAQ